MARTLLHLSVSPRANASQSRPVGAELVTRLCAACPDLKIVRRDLGSEIPPHPDAAFMNANLRREAERDGADQQALRYSELLIAELVAADLLVIDTPMHNFTVPSALKAWIDYVVRPGRSFQSSPTGKLPLLKDRPARIAVACGGSFSGPHAQRDFLTPYLRYVFNVIGIEDVDCLLLEQVLRGDETKAIAKQRADDWISAQVLQLSGLATAV